VSSLRAASSRNARGFTVPAGARDEERAREQAADWIEREHGRLDILVNNAGIACGLYINDPTVWT
jgi:NAD(P)-dependent dehydrogenase (short-subunit alcohol dehydrogenase family)